MLANTSAGGAHTVAGEGGSNTTPGQESKPICRVENTSTSSSMRSMIGLVCTDDSCQDEMACRSPSPVQVRHDSYSVMLYQAFAHGLG